MNLSRLKELSVHFERVPLRRIAFIAGGIVFLIVACIVIFSEPSSNSTEAKEIEVLEKLISLQADLQSLKVDLEKKRTALNTNASPSPRYYGSNASKSSDHFVGFTPKEGFQEITKTKTDLYIPRGSVFKAGHEATNSQRDSSDRYGKTKPSVERTHCPLRHNGSSVRSPN